MNRKLLLFACVLSALQSFAQPQYRLQSFSRYEFQFLTGGFELNDTAHFFYGGIYGGVLVPDYFNPELNGKVVDLSGEDIERTDLLIGFDTAYIHQRTDPPSPHSIRHNVYDNGMLKASHKAHIQPFPITKKVSDSFTYNGSRVATVGRYTTNGWILDSFSYDNNGRLLHCRRVGSVPAAAKRCDYTYDANGQLTELTWYDAGNTMIQRFAYTYTNNLLTSEKEEKMHFSWMVVSIKNYSYNIAGKLIRTELLRSGTDPYAMFYYSYDNAGNLVESKRAFWETSLNAYQDYTRALWTYNNNNLPVYAESQHYDPNSQNWYHRADTISGFSDRRLNFYYQLYWSTSVAQTSRNTTFNVYPVPANGFVNVNVEWNQPQAFTATIVNMEGRIIKQWKEEKTKKYAKTISLPELSPGNYFLKLEGEHEKAEKQMVITQ